MPITTLALFDAALKQSVRIKKNFDNPANSDKWASCVFFSGVNATPGAMSAIGNTTTGLVPVAGDSGIPTVQPFSGSGYLSRIFTTIAPNLTGEGDVYFRVMLYDRLWHAGAFTAGTPVTLSSQPSFASRLPGGNYNGTQLWYEAASNTGAGSITFRYTNQDGVAGKLSTTTFFTDTTAAAHHLPLAAGDTGIQKLEAITATSGSGTFNLVIVRPLYINRFDYKMLPSVTHGMDALGFPQVFQTSAFALMAYKEATDASGGPVWDMDIEIASDADPSGADAGPTSLGSSTVTWSPTDKNALATRTLSNGNLTITGVAGDPFPGVRGTTSHSTGKYYFEVLATTVNTGTNSPAIGVARATWDESNLGASDWWAIQSSPQFFWHAGSATASGVSYADGDVYQVAVDVGAGKIWFGRNGLWVLGGVPATGTNPSATDLSGTVFPAARVSGSPCVVTARFDPASWQFACPTGFGPW